MEKSNGRIHYAWWILVVCFLMNVTTHALHFQIGGLFTKPLAENFSVPRSVFALQNIAVTIAAVISAPIWGRLYRKYDARKLLAFCTFMTALGAILRSIAPNIIVVIAIGFMRGIFLTGNTVLPNTILLTAWFQKKRGFAISTAGLGISAGSAIFNPVIQSIITNSGWRAADRFIGLVIMVVMIPLVLILIRNTPAEKGLQAYGYEGQAQDKDKSKKRKAQETTGITLKEARSLPAFYIFLFVVFSTTFVTGAWLQLSPYLTDIGYSPATAAKALAFYSVISMVGKVVMGQVFDKMKLKSSSVLVCLTGALTFAFLIFAKNPYALILAFIFWAFAGGVTSIMIPLWTSTFFGTKDYSSIYGWVLSINRLGGMIGSFLVSFLYDIRGNNDLIWPICVAVMVLSTFGILYCLKTSNKWQSELESQPS